MRVLPSQLLRRKLFLAIGIGVSSCTIINRVDMKAKAEDNLIIETRPFAEGKYRVAYRGKYFTKDGEERLVAIKTIKPKYCEVLPHESITMILAQQRAKELSDVYNSIVPTTAQVQFIPVQLYKMPRDFTDIDGNIILNKGETVALEPLLEGNFEKFNSNTGWTRNDLQNPGAFIHWTWHHTKELIVCDLQGVRSGWDEGYMLTDPAICSKNLMYGNTDLGMEGINAFFKSHNCGPLCLGLDKPNYS